MSILTREMLPFKLRAKRHRGNMITALASGDRFKAEEEFRNAESAIYEAFQYLAKYERPDPETPGHASEGEIAVAEQLADFWGIQGGLYAREGARCRMDPAAAIWRPRSRHTIGARATSHRNASGYSTVTTR